LILRDNESTGSKTFFRGRNGTWQKDYRGILQNEKNESTKW
jgi:hypothetical protein